MNKIIEIKINTYYTNNYKDDLSFTILLVDIGDSGMPPLYIIKGYTEFSFYCGKVSFINDVPQYEVPLTNTYNIDTNTVKCYYDEHMYFCFDYDELVYHLEKIGIGGSFRLA